MYWAGIAQSLQRLTTGRTVCGSNPGGVRDFPQLPKPVRGPTQLPVQWVLVIFPGGKSGWGLALPTYPRLVHILKKAQSRTTTALLGFRGLIQGAHCCILINVTSNVRSMKKNLLQIMLFVMNYEVEILFLLVSMFAVIFFDVRRIMFTVARLQERRLIREITLLAT